MLGKGEKRLVAAYSAAHFAVDLCCAMLVLPAARAASDKAMALLIYNFCAFAMQLPIGVLPDVGNHLIQKESAQIVDPRFQVLIKQKIGGTLWR